MQAEAQSAWSATIYAKAEAEGKDRVKHGDQKAIRHLEPLAIKYSTVYAKLRWWGYSTFKQQ